MATYGVDIRTGVARDGRVKFTGWTSILGDQANSSTGAVNIGQSSGAVYFNGLTSNDRKIRQAFMGRGPINLAIRQMFINMLGGTAGVAGTGAGNIYKQVQGPAQGSVGGNVGFDLGGLRPIEQSTVNNRTMQAADRDSMRGVFLVSSYPTAHGLPSSAVIQRQGTYPDDVSDNGGGRRGPQFPFR
jgi:hypothetical protein